MKKISSCETYQETINGMVVTAEVNNNRSDKNRIDATGGVVGNTPTGVYTENGEWQAGFTLHQDGCLNVNFSASVTDRTAVLTAIESFITEATAENE